VAVIWDKEISQLFTLHCKQTQKVEYNESQRPTRAISLFTGQIHGPVQCLSGSLSQSSLCCFVFVVEIKHNAQDRTGLAHRVSGVLCFG
jgi:hypothetical protein